LGLLSEVFKFFAFVTIGFGIVTLVSKDEKLIYNLLACNTITGCTNLQTFKSKEVCEKVKSELQSEQDLSKLFCIGDK
jgi:hypothetical protein